MLTVPSPADYPNSDDFWTAYYAYRRQVDAQHRADVLAQIVAGGGRGDRCPCGYGPLDTCPVHDN